ncbi:MAG TPA: hypothetical protein VML54_11100 [Candidatus Limnocylindrales bacterium]|nr:hypothetical protein [Candidatus Limnocylindrales bacterium]
MAGGIAEGELARTMTYSRNAEYVAQPARPASTPVATPFGKHTASGSANSGWPR